MDLSLAGEIILLRVIVITNIVALIGAIAALIYIYRK